MTLLNLVLALPLAGFLIVLLMPREKPQIIRGVALVVALLTFILSIGLATGLRSDAPGAQFSTDVIWIPSPEIHYHVGIDGLSLWLVLLSAFPAVLWFVWGRLGRRVTGPTWDCGLPGLTAANEYTATGFSKPIRMIFSALYRRAP